MARLYEQIDVTAADGTDETSVAFTSTRTVPRTLEKVQVNNTSADLDLLIYDEREKIADIPCDINPFADKWIEVDRAIEQGHELKVGIRNNTGASVTAAICYVTIVPD